jgi:hypothetical protein
MSDTTEHEDPMSIPKPAHPTPHVPIGALLAMLALSGACAPPEELDPLVGSWTSTMRIADEYNEMALDADLVGDATIYFYFDGDAYYADFDVTAERRGQDLYQLDLECQGDCSDLDFAAWCDLLGRALVCEGNGGWEDYEFEWARD